MENNEAFNELIAKLDAFTAKIDGLSDVLSTLVAKLNGNSAILSVNGGLNTDTGAILSANGGVKGVNSALNEKIITSLESEVKKQERLDFRESVPSQLSKIMYLISERGNASSGDIRIHLKLGEPTYRRYITFLRKWGWIELTPGTKRGNFVLSKKGKELMDKILSANK